MTELNDQSLLAHWYRNRNAEAFRILASRHARMVYATALRILRNAHDAEEVSQQSFLALAQTKRPPSTNVAAWLHRTACRAALNLTRARKRRTARDHAYAAAQPDAARTEWDDIRDLVDEAVAGLPDAYRECVVLYFFEEQTHAAIGEGLGITRQAVAQRIEKGIALVRKRLASKGVVAPAAAGLVALIHENTYAGALPSTLATELGRIALAATPSMWAVAGTYAGGAALKVAAAALIIGSALIVTGLDHTFVPDTGDSMANAASTLSTTEERVSSAANPADSIAIAEGEGALAMVGGKANEAIALSTMASVSGVVLLPGDRPFKDAIVSLIDLSKIDLYGRLTEPLEVRQPVHADGTGRFSIQNLPPAEYGAYVANTSSEGWSVRMEVARFTLARGEHLENVKLLYGTEGDLRVAGAVVNTAGEPLEGVMVSTALSSASRSATTGKDGRFTLDYLPDEQLRVEAAHDDYRSNGMNVRAGAQDLRIVLVANGAINGHVVDGKTHKPVEGIEVSVINGHVSEFTSENVGVATLAQGSLGYFYFDPMPAGDLTVAVRAAGYATGLAPVTVVEGQTVDGLVIELQPDAGRRLAGKVVTEDGTPVEGAKIYTEARPADGLSPATVSDALGSFEITKALPEAHVLQATHPDFAPAFEAASGNMTLVVKRACRLIVNIYSDGVPRPKTSVALLVAGYGWNPEARTDETGRVTFDNFAPGELELHVQLSNERTQIESLSIAPGEEKVVRVDVASGIASVEGTVYVDGGLTTKGIARLFVETETGAETLTQSIAVDGTFRFPEAPLGTARLVVSTGTPSRRAFVDEVSLVAGQVTTLTVDATATAHLNGTVNGLGQDEEAQMTLFRGTLELDNALAIANGSPMEPEIASRPKFDEFGAYEVGLQKPGPYTVLLFTCPKGDFTQRVQREYRVVEVPESGELEVNFTLPQ